LDSDDAIAAISKIEEEPIEEVADTTIVEENAATTEAKSEDENSDSEEAIND
jgi:hypothetical protein